MFMCTFYEYSTYSHWKPAKGGIAFSELTVYCVLVVVVKQLWLADLHVGSHKASPLPSCTYGFDV